MAKRQGRRQRVRKALILISLLLFPVIMNYLSPYVIIDGAMNGVVNGSFIVFILLVLSALFVGRLWCGWICPGAGLEEACHAINDKPARGGKLNWIKRFISTAYSMGNSLTMGSIKPLTIIIIACSSVMPRLIR